MNCNPFDNHHRRLLSIQKPSHSSLNSCSMVVKWFISWLFPFFAFFDRVPKGPKSQPNAIKRPRLSISTKRMKASKTAMLCALGEVKPLNFGNRRIARKVKLMQLASWVSAISITFSTSYNAEYHAKMNNACVNPKEPRVSNELNFPHDVYGVRDSSCQGYTPGSRLQRWRILYILESICWKSLKIEREQNEKDGEKSVHASI